MARKNSVNTCMAPASRRVRAQIAALLMTTALAACQQHGEASPSAQAAASPADAALTLEQLNERAVHARAVEAVIWGMPAVNYDLMRQTMLKVTEAKENDVVYWSKPADWKNQTLTPNPDSIYFICYYNLKDGPLVIDVPPADGGSFAGNIVNAWQMPLEDAGPYGADEGKGGKYLLLPPGYKDKVPSGYIVLHDDTYGGFALLRSNLKSHADTDVAASVAYGKRLKVYPLALAAKPPETKFVDAYGTLFDSTIQWDASFFRNLDNIIQQEPWLDRDRLMIDALKTLGIEKGKPYTPDPKQDAALNDAVKEAEARMAARYDEGFGRMAPEYRWFAAAVPEVIRAVASGYANLNEYPVDIRGVTYTLGFTGIKRIGTAQFYLMVAKDKDGVDFDGAKTYKLTVPANPPIKNYWSVTVYDRETHALVRNMDRASVASISPGVQQNADGSVDVYFGAKAPQGKESNWVPTDPQRRFELLFRLYAPEKPFFDKTWKLPDVEVLK